MKPCAVWLVMLLVPACGHSGATRPAVAAFAPITPAPWHAELRPCPSLDPALGVQQARVGDIDGDGRPDIVVAICGGATATRDACAVQLCLTTEAGGLALAASWLSAQPDLVRPLPGPAPRAFEAYPADSSGPCSRVQHFDWVRGDGGYLASGELRCECGEAEADDSRCGGTR